MSDVDRSPTPFDVFEETILALDERDYDGHVLVVAKKEYLPRPSEMTGREYIDLLCTNPNWFARCFAGQAIVARAKAFETVGSYADIAAAYGVPTLLVEVIGGGVVGMEFADAKRYVQAAISLFREESVQYPDVTSISNYMRVVEQAKLRAGLIGGDNE